MQLFLKNDHEFQALYPWNPNCYSAGFKGIRKLLKPALSSEILTSKFGLAMSASIKFLASGAIFSKAPNYF